MKIISKETKFLLALSHLKGIGPAAIKSIADIDDINNLNIDYIVTHHKKIQSLLSDDTKNWEKCLAFVDKQVDYADKYQARIISILDDDYPPLLKTSMEDPSILFVRGNLFSNPNSSVGVIGTREPTNHGKIITERICNFFIENNWSIVSGLAIGCDTIAHQTAVKHKSHTLAVLAHGLEIIAPKQNERLAQDILSLGGALVSQFPFGTEIRPTNFVVRDKVQAGLSQGIIMVQSDVKGGSLHASRAILTNNRWLAIPNPTSLDRQNQERKIGANLVIIDGESSDIELLLKCKKSDLNNIIKLYGKDDYSKMLAKNTRTEQFSLV